MKAMYYIFYQFKDQILNGIKMCKKSKYENFCRWTGDNWQARPITDVNKVKEVTEKFRSKYGDSDVKKYYTKFDVGVELALQ
jgi:hypothetical protein